MMTMVSQIYSCCMQFKLEGFLQSIAITAICMQLDLIIPATVTPAVILVGVTFTLVLLIVYFIAKKSSRTKNEPDQWYTLAFNNKAT